jgi:hypothetical protein
MSARTKCFTAFLAAVLIGIAVTASASANDQAGKTVVCKMIAIHLPGKSWMFHELLFKVNLEASVCYNGRQIVSIDESCYISNQNMITIDATSCETKHVYYGWGPAGAPQDPQGGVISEGTVTIRNCIFHWGCWAGDQITLRLFIAASGYYVPDYIY